MDFKQGPLFKDWAKQTPDQILYDFNFALVVAWEGEGDPMHLSARVELPPREFGFVREVVIATKAGLCTLKQYIEERNVLACAAGKLEIVEGTEDCMVVTFPDRQPSMRRFYWEAP